MISIEEKLKEFDIQLAENPKPLGAYVPSKISGNLLFISGQLPIKNGKLVYTGKLGSDLTVEQGYEASRLAAINVLSVIKSKLGDFNELTGIVKVTGYVSSAPGFNSQADVINGASDIFAGIMGEHGKHARVAVGVSELPLNSAVEIEVVAEISADYSY